MQGSVHGGFRLARFWKSLRASAMVCLSDFNKEICARVVGSYYTIRMKRLIQVEVEVVCSVFDGLIVCSYFNAKNEVYCNKGSVQCW